MSILDAFFPKRCVGCGKLGEYICKKCRFSIKYIDPVKGGICPVCEKSAVEGITHPVCRGRYTPEGLISFFRYDGAVKKALKTVKYKLVTCAAEDLTGLIPLTSYNFILNRVNPENTLIIPVPLHKKRLRERGFNQAEIYAKLISDKLRIPVRKNILKRVRYTEPQVEMKSRDKRLANMDKVFEANSLAIKQFSSATIILLDDVFTTGATIRAAANVLKRAGFNRVWAVAIAR